MMIFLAAASILVDEAAARAQIDGRCGGSEVCSVNQWEGFRALKSALDKPTLSADDKQKIVGIIEYQTSDKGTDWFWAAKVYRAEFKVPPDRLWPADPAYSRSNTDNRHRCTIETKRTQTYNGVKIVSESWCD